MIISPPRSTYRFSYVIQFAVLLPIALFAFVAYLEYSKDTGGSSDPTVVIALGLSAIACVLLFLYLHSQCVSIHDEGLVEKRLFFRSKQIEWKDVKETRYTQTALSQDLLIHLGLLGALLSPFIAKKESAKKGTQELKVVGASKTKITLSNYFKNVREAIRTTLERVNPPLLAAARTQYQAGQSVAFGDLVITRSTLRWKKKEIAFSDIESAKLLGREFRVKQKGKWLDVIVVPSQKIPNIFVAMDLLEEFRAGVRITDSSQSSMVATV